MSSRPSTPLPPIPASRRHIIKRPRLTRLLDETSARIITLVAPAGYGKTTLAREWLADGHRAHVWHRFSSGSVDIARLAAEFASALGAIDPDAAQRVATYLRAAERGGLNVQALVDL